MSPPIPSPPPCPKDLDGFKLEDLKDEKCSIHRSKECACWTEQLLKNPFKHCRKKYEHVLGLFKHYESYFTTVKQYLSRLDANDVQSMRNYLGSINFNGASSLTDDQVKREINMKMEQIDQFREMLDQFKTSIERTLEGDVDKELEKWKSEKSNESRKKRREKISQVQYAIETAKGFMRFNPQNRAEYEKTLKQLEEELKNLGVQKAQETMDLRAAIGRHKANCHMYETGIIELIKTLTGQYNEPYLKPLDRVPKVPPPSE